MIRLHHLFLALVCALLCACATGRPAGLVYTAGARVETLSSPVALSFSSSQGGMAGNGFMVYGRPDRMRLVILSPFGTTLSEVFVDGERITILDPGKGFAYGGRSDELPDLPQFHAWRLVRWVMEVDPPGSVTGDGSVERVNRLGLRERAEFENGLLVKKTLDDGSEARYGGFVVMDGIPLATEIVMMNPAGDRFRITLKEPELNAPLAPDVFTPHLDGLRLLPLAALKEE